jgi:hypothetical protein
MNELDLMRRIKEVRKTVKKMRSESGHLEAIEVTPELDKLVHEQMQEDMKKTGVSSYNGAFAKVMKRVNQ